jgi:hypothetical protein
VTVSHDSGDRLKIPAVTSKSAIVWCVGTLIVAMGVLAYLSVTQPENRWTLWVILPLVTLFVLFVATRRCWIETETGTVVWQRFWFSRTYLRLGEARTVEFVSVPNGSLSLGLRAPGVRMRRHLPVIVRTVYVDKSQAPEVLTALADQIQHWVPGQVHGRVPKELRAQAKHIASGGGLRDSPLNRLTQRGLDRGIGAGGAAGGGAGLFG